jgi:hypothetical protein
MTEFAYVLDNVAAEASHCMDDIQSSGQPREYQDNDLNAASMRAFSVEGAIPVYNGEQSSCGLKEPILTPFEDIFSEQGVPCNDVEMKNRLSATRKRKHAFFADTPASIEELDYTSRPASEDSRSTKRRSVQPQTESLAPSPACTPTSTTTLLPQARGSHFSPLRVSNNHNASGRNGGGKDDGANISDLSRSDLHLQNGGDGEHHKGAIEKELLHSSEQSIPLSERRLGDQDFSPDLEKGEDKSDASDGEVGQSHEDEPSQADDVSVTSSRRREPSNRCFRKKGRGTSRTALRPRDWNTMRTKTSRQVLSSQSQHLFRPRTDMVTRSSPPTNILSKDEGC